MTSPDRPGAAHAPDDSLWHACARLIGAPTAPNRRAATRRLMRQLALVAGLGAVVVIGLMVVADAPVIMMMPSRGAPQLWPFRWITDFGKAAYVLWASGLAVLAALVITPLLRGRVRLAMSGLDVRLAFVFLSVGLADLIGEGLKGAIGRARPFVGGRADVFQFSPGTWHEPFESLPSAHAITAVALAGAVAMAWPRSRFVMAAYALAIIVSRVALLAHHPSDVVAGALVGVAGTLVVRYWFATRQLGFAIDADGAVAELP
ncbi:MAG: phosphatase PAP2 family protein [Xanthobacteraceae bacterium]|nr:phosphatase PAP2 family protein [Xanthobacteraceae bacterium]